MHRTATIQRSRLIDLNLLPAEMRPHRYPRWYAMGLAAVLTACVLLVPAIAIQHSASQETAHLREELALITGQLQGTQVDIGQERGIRTEITQTEQVMAALQAELASLPGAGGPLAQDLSLVYSDAPPDVHIISASRGDKTITASGEARNIEGVIAYAKALNQSKVFSDVTITQAAGSAGGAVTFSVLAAQWGGAWA